MKYSYQKFLLQCDYENISLSDTPCFMGDISCVLDFREERCLFDIGPMIRKIDLSYLDETVDTEDDWNNIVALLKKADIIVIYNSKFDNHSLIFTDYREATIKAYLYRLKTLNKKVYIA